LLNFKAIKETRLSKYDMLFKNMLLDYNSSLLLALKVPNGTVAAMELPGFDSRRVDGIVDADEAIYHIEFQTKRDQDMKWRMLEYYFKIVEHYADDNFVLDRPVEQILVYVGGRVRGSEDDSPLKPPLKRDRTVHGYKYIDLRKLDVSLSKLESSDLPMDWILRVLCDDSIHDHHWQQVARQINRYAKTNPHGSGLLKASLLIAAALREIERHKARKLEDLLQVNIKDIPLLADAYDDLEARVAKRTAYRSVMRAFDSRRMEVKSDIDDFLQDCEEDELQDLLPVIYRAKSRAEIDHALAMIARNRGVRLPGL
jgi:hypothetical protein